MIKHKSKKKKQSERKKKTKYNEDLSSYYSDSDLILDIDIELKNENEETSSSSTSSFFPLKKVFSRKQRKEKPELVKTILSFFIFGLLNNLTYVIFLSAAEDLIPETLPKSIVLSCDIVPTLIIKMTAPWYMSKIPYTIRVVLVVLFASSGCLISGFIQNTVIRLLGVVCASISCGLGEITFLAMCSFYNSSIASWSSGTGFAGVVGSVLYLFLRSVLGLSQQSSLLFCSFLPLVMLLPYFLLLDRKKITKTQTTLAKDSKNENRSLLSGSSNHESDDRSNGSKKGTKSTQDKKGKKKYKSSSSSSGTGSGTSSGTSSSSNTDSDSKPQKNPNTKTSTTTNVDTNTTTTTDPNTNKNNKTTNDHVNERNQLLPKKKKLVEDMNLSEKMVLIKPLLKYMIPLLVVYYSEYSIIIGIAPVLKWEGKWIKKGDYYRIFQVIYQVGVFISRSSIKFIKIHRVWIMALIQVFLFIFLFFVGWKMFFDYWAVFIVYSFVGLLGGGTYVNAFYFIKKSTDHMYREFSLGIASVADSAGVCISSFTSMWIETWLFRNQK
ncbi:battenin [Anaeramoeba flamelloides]|uniref:Battenin n=1 Tax=Anaeramoeba flamelloides TaxID=1746091 RepID=A0ABQ8XLU9_9EUKA|nr:battenin [Anaeramoeba flamelloides]